MSPCPLMADGDEGGTGGGISRRTLIKGGLVAGAAVWVAPVIDSIETAAAAASRAPGCPSFACDGSTVSPLCGNAGPGGVCFCAPTVEHSDACVSAEGLFGPFNCTSSAQCGPGNFCIELDPAHCYGFTAACAAPCPPAPV